MMTPDQITALAEVRANYVHIVDSLKKLDTRLDEFHRDMKLYASEADVKALRAELATLREQIEELKRNSPASLWRRMVGIAAGVGILGSALAIITQYINIEVRK